MEGAVGSSTVAEKNNWRLRIWCILSMRICKRVTARCGTHGMMEANGSRKVLRQSREDCAARRKAVGTKVTPLAV